MPLAKNKKVDDLQRHAPVQEPYWAPTTASGRAVSPVSAASLRDGNALTSRESWGAWAGTRCPPPQPLQWGTSPVQKHRMRGVGIGSAWPWRGLVATRHPEVMRARGCGHTSLLRPGPTRWPSFPGVLRRGGPRRGSGAGAPPEGHGACLSLAAARGLGCWRGATRRPLLPQTWPVVPPDRLDPGGRGEASGLWPGPLPAPGGEAPAPSLCVLLC